MSAKTLPELAKLCGEAALIQEDRIFFIAKATAEDHVVVHNPHDEPFVMKVQQIPFTQLAEALEEQHRLKTENDEYRATIQLKYLRDAGWSVGVHNDYYHGGAFFTFWLFTHPSSGRFLKGEGRSDAEAIRKVHEAVTGKPSPTNSSLPAHCVTCGHITNDLPRLRACPGCGGYAWGSPSAPFPDKHKAKLARQQFQGDRPSPYDAGVGPLNKDKR